MPNTLEEPSDTRMGGVGEGAKSLGREGELLE